MRVVREGMAEEGVELLIGREVHGGIASQRERPTVTNSGTLVLRVGETNQHDGKHTYHISLINEVPPWSN